MALRPEFVVTAGVTLRRVTDLHESQPLVRANGVERIAQRSDFLAESRTVGGHRYDYSVYRPGVRPTGGTLLTNGSREQEAVGASLGIVKRLSNPPSVRVVPAARATSSSIPSGP